METAAGRWANMVKSGGEQLQSWLAGALSDSLKVQCPAFDSRGTVIGANQSPALG